MMPFSLLFGRPLSSFYQKNVSFRHPLKTNTPFNMNSSFTRIPAHKKSGSGRPSGRKKWELEAKGREEEEERKKKKV